MKSFILLLGVIGTASAYANASNQICSVTGTKIKFDLSANDPPALEGSRFFHGFTLSKSGNLSSPDLTVEPKRDHEQYVINFADGVLKDGAGYFVLSVADPRTGKELYAFSRAKSATHAATSAFYSTLPEVDFPQNDDTRITCGER